MGYVINEREIGRIARKVLDFLSKNKIDSVEKLEPFIGKSFGGEDKKVIAEMRPSELGTSAYSIAYFVYGMGVPLELRSNTRLGYSIITFKGCFQLSDYEVFAVDTFGNFIQTKGFGSSDLSGVRSELEKLAKFG